MSTGQYCALLKREAHHRQWRALLRETSRPDSSATGVGPALEDVDALLEGIEAQTDDGDVRAWARDARQLLHVVWIAHYEFEK
jgi:hypothetical protein